MNVSLPPYFESLIQEKLASGKYGNASEVVRDALRLLDERDKAREADQAEHEAKLAWLRQAVREGFDSPVVPWDGAEGIIRKARAERDAKRSPQVG